MKAKLVALDIDGTILDKSTGFTVPAAVRETVRDARKAGARICICSSRPCYMMEDATSALDGIDALAGCSGAVIEATSALDGADVLGGCSGAVIGATSELDGADVLGGCSGAVIEAVGAAAREGLVTIYADSLASPLVRASFETAKRLGLPLSFAGEKEIFVLKRGALDPSLANDPIFKIMEEEELLEILKKKPVSCSFIFLESGMSDELVTRASVLADATVNHAGHNCLVITNKGTDKGTGVLHLAEYWRIPREAILAVGNDENDVPMLKAAGVGVAVANACPETLAAADWVAPDVLHAGAAEAIRRYALLQAFDCFP